MADRPEREVRRGGRKGRKKVCSFCVDRAPYIDYKDVAKLRRLISLEPERSANRKRPSPGGKPRV